MRETLTPIAGRCCSDNNDGAHGDPRPTGCEYGFRKRLRCKKCPHWSEARFGASLGELMAEGFVEGVENLPNKAKASTSRLCEVDGNVCFFHRWCDEDRALLQFNALVRREEAEEQRTLFDDRGICSPSANIETVRNTFALVEFQDGTVKKVDPERVRFINGKEKRR